jgi:hypothetical protein
MEVKMPRIRESVLLLSIVSLLGSAVAGQSTRFIDWQALHNPILSYPDWSIKDSAMTYRAGVFYVFFSAFYNDQGQVRSHVVEVTTKDFGIFSKPILNVSGMEDGWIGMCSPDVQQLYGKYVMTFNSWGDKPGKPNELFSMTSSDLIHWSERHTLALNLTGDGQEHRVIDAALASADGGYYLLYKDQTPGAPKKPRLAFGKSLSGDFHYVGDGYPEFDMADGKGNGKIHENYEFVKTKTKWYVVATDYPPQSVELYSRTLRDPWLKWTAGYELSIPSEDFNRDNLDNAAALYDWRKYDGYFYLLYAGRNEAISYAKRGWNQLALARSKDLVRWEAAGSGR